MREQDNNKKRKPSIPEENPSKAMDSKKEVERSPDERTDEDFPGYPHYPAREDIMDERTDTHRVDMDVENLPSGRNATGVSQRFITSQEHDRQREPRVPDQGVSDNDLDLRSGTDADVDEDDLAVLNSTNAEIGIPQNVSNEDLNTDLDIPGSELDDENERIGEEDEENNYYSLGGDAHENLEEDKGG
jgi:hypothetical protein